MTIRSGEDGRSLEDNSKFVKHTKAVEMAMVSGKVSGSSAFVREPTHDLSGEADTERVQRTKALRHAP